MNEWLPDVDVVIATHHRPELLKMALQAVLDQTYAGKITCVVVFDQSEPDLALEQDDQGARRVEVVTNVRRPGLAGARNSGILAGTGELVAFCDDDDEWLPGKLAAQIDQLGLQGADTCVTGIVVEYGDHAQERIPTPEQMSLDVLARNRTMAAHPSTVVVRRTALVGPIGLVDEDIPGSYGEDFDWILRSAEHGPIAVVEEPLVKVRWGQSLFSRNWQTIIDAIDYGFTKHARFSADPRARARLLGRKAFAQAALGRRRAAVRTAAASWRSSPRERRAYLTFAVAAGVVSAERLLKMAHARGHGI
ncbi:MAG: glycosyltransferase family 2 protein [Janthinobacterium lividum]